MSAFNLPPGCPHVSDVDFYASQRLFTDEADTDPTPDHEPEPIAFWDTKAEYFDYTREREAGR